MEIVFRKPQAVKPLPSLDLAARSACARQLARRHGVGADWWAAADEDLFNLAYDMFDDEPRVADRLRRTVGRVAGCEVTRAQVWRCKHGDDEHWRPLPCGSRACPSCERRRIPALRGRVAEGVAKLREIAAAAPGWRVQHITVTLPHDEPLRDRVRRVRRARTELPRLLAAYVAALGVEVPPACRGRGGITLPRIGAIEVSPGSAGDGHPHLHLLLVAPELDPVVVAHLAGRALYRSPSAPDFAPRRTLQDVLADVDDPERREHLRRTLRTRRGCRGRPVEYVYAVDVHIARADERAAAEVVKDVIPRPGTCDPYVFALCLSAVIDVRHVTWSRGLLRPRAAPGPPACRRNPEHGPLVYVGIEPLTWAPLSVAMTWRNAA